MGNPIFYKCTSNSHEKRHFVSLSAVMKILNRKSSFSNDKLLKWCKIADWGTLEHYTQIYNLEIFTAIDNVLRFLFLVRRTVNEPTTHYRTAWYCRTRRPWSSSNRNRYQYKSSRYCVIIEIIIVFQIFAELFLSKRFAVWLQILSKGTRGLISLQEMKSFKAVKTFAIAFLLATVTAVAAAESGDSVSAVFPAGENWRP